MPGAQLERKIPFTRGRVGAAAAAAAGGDCRAFSRRRVIQLFLTKPSKSESAEGCC